MLNPIQKRYDDSKYRSLSHAFADLISGEWDFDGLNHADRVATIHTITTLMEGLMKTGWIEHTNDWDWRISVVWGEAKLVAGTYDGEADDYSDAVWADVIRLDHDEPEDHEKCQYLTVEEFRNDQTDPHDVLIPIDQIRTIIVGEA